MKRFLHAEVTKERADDMPGGHELEREDINHFVEQLDFLDSSCMLYDAGSRAEAKRLATTVRVLLHDTKFSTSLLRRLGLKEAVSWADGVVDEWLKDVIKEQGAGQLMSVSLLTTIKLPVGFLESPDLVKYVPVCEVQVLGERWVPFDYWWTATRIVDGDLRSVSRKQIVLYLANKAGGAHIDDLPESWQRIERESGMGIRLSNIPGNTAADDSPIPAAMRQIAEEVRFTLRENLGHLIDIKQHLDEIEP
ncbi:hypothetical protein ANMWB30_23340 [Arthrobacter sp. MWB30]|nr:hypothetical protein ANMWB30_23340 [Arthrobacter sp. MWB30]